MTLKPGFVTFEGTEGSGKTSQIRLLADALERFGRRVVVTREPGGTPLGETLRGLLLESAVPIGPETEAYLMTAARAEHVRHVIRPALDDGAVVLCDRFADSTFAYQGGGRGLPLDLLRALQCLAVGDIWPTVTILLDVPVEVGLLRRRGEPGMNRIDHETRDFHARVAGWYREEAERDPARWIVVDGTRAPHLVHTAVLEQTLERLGLSALAQRGDLVR